jgi:pimeloyl-ACP methyl ester carboxylesterase
MSGFQILLSVCVVVALLLFGGIWAFQSFGVYRFAQASGDPQDFGLTGVRVVKFRSEDGAEARAWLAEPAPGRPILFSFHGNFAAIGPSLQRLAPLMADGTGIVMLHYRGAGDLPGRSSEENFARDARALYDQLDVLAGQVIAPERRVLHGFSLGAGVAVRLASERRFAGLVLEAAVPRVCLYFQRRYHNLPFCTLMWAERYDSIDRIGGLRMRKLFVHGAKDGDVPLLWGQQLFAAAPEPKQFITLPDGDHADLAKHGLIAALQEFLRNRVD